MIANARIFAHVGAAGLLVKKEETAFLPRSGQVFPFRPVAILEALRFCKPQSGINFRLVEVDFHY